VDGRAWILSLVATLVLVAFVASLVIPPAPRPADPIRSTTAPSEAAESAPPRIAPADLYAAIASPGSGTSFSQSVTLTVEDAGHVVLPTGRLVASDAFIIDSLPFAEAVPRGRYAVSVLVADFADGDRRVAAAMVTVAPNQPVRWELALVPGQDTSTLGPDEFFGYGVDGGTGSFTSPEATEHLKDRGAYETYSQKLMAAMNPGDGVFPLTVAVDIDPGSGANVVAFSSGFGDGAYPTFVGLRSDGEPAVLLTDFGVLDAPGAQARSH